MDNWGSHIKRLREAKGLSQTELGKKAGLVPSHISRIEAGQYQNPLHKTIERLARGLGMTDSQLSYVLRGEIPKMPQETPEEILQKLKLAQPISIPVYDDFRFHATESTFPLEYIYRTPSKKSTSNIEGYIVHGDCLKPTINNNDIIVVDRDGEINNGDTIACLIHGEFHIARLRKIVDELWLESNNHRHKFEECEMAAPVIEVIRRLK